MYVWNVGTAKAAWLTASTMLMVSQLAKLDSFIVMFTPPKVCLLSRLRQTKYLCRIIALSKLCQHIAGNMDLCFLRDLSEDAPPETFICKYDIISAKINQEPELCSLTTIVTILGKCVCKFVGKIISGRACYFSMIISENFSPRCELLFSAQQRISYFGLQDPSLSSESVPSLQKERVFAF